MNINIPDNLSANQLIALLKKEYPFEGIAIFPFGVFWWVLFAIIALYLVYYYLISNNRFVKKYLAKLEFKKILNMIKKNEDNQKITLNLANIIRRVAVVVFGYKKIANLHGVKWIDFLIAHDNKLRFNLENLNLLANAPYRDKQNLDNINIMDVYNQSYLWSMDVL